MASFVCPNCGRLYAHPPNNGMCVDCDLVRLVRDRKGATAGVASAVAHERGHQLRNALVLTGMALGFGLGVAAAAVVGFFGLVITLALPMATGALVWGVGVVIAEVRKGIWPRRSRRQRMAAVAMAVGGFLGTGTCAGAYRAAHAQHQREVRTRWVTSLNINALELSPCFERGDWIGRFQLRWHRESGNVAVTTDLETDIGACMAERAASWKPPLADNGSVTCSFVAAYRKRNRGLKLGIHIARRDPHSPHLCLWQATRSGH